MSSKVGYASPTLPEDRLTQSASAQTKQLTSSARRQSWNDLRVRFWIGLFGITLLVISAMTFRQISRGIEERSFLDQSVSVDARILEISGLTNIRAMSLSTAQPVRVEFTLPGETEPRVVEGYMPAGPGSISVDDQLTLRVNPNEPSKFTNQIQPTLWAYQLSLPAVLLPALLLVLAVALVKRSSVIKTAQTGILRAAQVVTVERSLLAPDARRLKVSLTDDPARRVFVVTWPNKSGGVAKGDVINLIVDNSNSTNAVVANAYDA